MKLIQRSLLTLLLSSLFVLTVKADDRVLKVWQADGQVLTISLADEPRTTYSDGNLIITSAKSTVTLPLEKVSTRTALGKRRMRAISFAHS